MPGQHLTYSRPNQNFFKLVALVAMVLDHINWIYFDCENTYLHLAGLLAFPLFCFLLTYNYLFNTRNKATFVKRLWLMAIISQAPYQWALGFPWHEIRLNIFVTLALGLMYIRVIEMLNSKKALFLVITVSWTCILVDFLNNKELSACLDGNACGISLFGCLYALYFNNTNYKLLAWISIYCIFFVLDSNFAIISLLPLLIVHYIGHKIQWDLSWTRRYKYFYYLFYPMHLAILKIFHKPVSYISILI